MLYVLGLLLFSSFPCFILSTSASSDVVIASYNLWNIMFHWDIRKFYIAEMIQDVNADIIGFQEVRAKSNLKHTQLDELQRLLPEYKYKIYVPIERVDNKHLRPGWEWEGIGFLSRHKILTSMAVNLTRPFGSPDKNNRVLLHCQFLIEKKDIEVNVILTHFSYDKRSQCSNAYEVMKYIYTIGTESVVITGDFNIYEDFMTPIKALSNGVFEEGTECEDIGNTFKQKDYETYGYEFQDAWAFINPHHPGFTFSNLPVPGLINRPDRILVSKVGIKIVSSLILGKGQFYKYKYGHSLHVDRYKRILQAAREGRISEDQNSTCAMDCGPWGSCRCGICISGGDQNNCRPTECKECSMAKLSLAYIIAVVMTPCVVYNLFFFSLFFFGVLRPRYRRWAMNNCRLRRFTSWKAMFVTLTILLLLFVYAYQAFSDVRRLVAMQMMEETQPSDHLMIVARLNFV